MADLFIGNLPTGEMRVAIGGKQADAPLDIAEAVTSQTILHVRGTSTGTNPLALFFEPTYTPAAGSVTTWGAYIAPVCAPAIDTITTIIGLTVVPTTGSAAGVMTASMIGIQVSASYGTQKPATAVRGIDVLNVGSSGITTATGVRIATPTGATNNYSLLITGTAALVGINTSTPGYMLDVVGDVRFGVAAGAAGSRIIGRGMHTSAPAGTLASGEWDIQVYDDGATPIFLFRYNDAGSTKTGSIPVT